MIWLSSDAPDLPEQLSKVIISGAWFADIKAGNVKYIGFNSTVLKYAIGNLTE